MPGEGGEKGGSGIWAESVYKSGFKDGQEATPGLTSQEIREALRLVKGIGAKRMDSIIEALSLALEEKGKAGEMA